MYFPPRIEISLSIKMPIPQQQNSIKTQIPGALLTRLSSGQFASSNAFELLVQTAKT